MGYNMRSYKGKRVDQRSIPKKAKDSTDTRTLKGITTNARKRKRE